MHIEAAFTGTDTDTITDTCTQTQTQTHAHRHRERQTQLHIYICICIFVGSRAFARMPPRGINIYVNPGILTERGTRTTHTVFLDQDTHWLNKIRCKRLNPEMRSQGFARDPLCTDPRSPACFAFDINLWQQLLHSQEQELLEGALRNSPTGKFQLTI